MAESASSSVDSLEESIAEPINDVLSEPLAEVLVDSGSLSARDQLDDADIVISGLNDTGVIRSHTGTQQTIDSRRRLEERLAERYLEKDMQEYDFDI